MNDELNPEYPMSLWASVQNRVRATKEVLERGLELDRGRHPLLSDLRMALGLELNTDDLYGMLFGGEFLGDDPSEAEILGDIDRAYNALSCPLRVVAEVGAAGLAVTSEADELVARDGELLPLWVFFRNSTGEDREFRVGAPGQPTGGGTVEAGRTASVLLPVSPPPVDRPGLSLSIVCGGDESVFDVPVSTRPAWNLSVRILDADSGDKVAARIYLKDDVGSVRQAGAVIRREEHGGDFFHTNGAFEARVSGDVILVVARGLEYEPCELTLEQPRGGRLEYDVPLRRWSDVSSDGWHGGDVHVHLHIGGEYLLDDAHASLTERAEDVQFMNMMVSNLGSGYVNDRGFFEGKPNAHSDAVHILRWGEEFRSQLYGHVCMYGIRELVPPFYTGFANSESPYDVPTNAEAADDCHRHGGILSYAHPLSRSHEIDNVFALPSGIFARELPVDMALGKIDALDIMSYTSNDLVTSELWYRLLNCGFRLPATAGTDTFMNLAASNWFRGAICDPPAGNRVYALVEGEFTTESWCGAVKAGRTFVTNGPVLSLTVDGMPIGSELVAASGQQVRVEASARSWAPMEDLQLVVNGEVVGQGAVEDGGRSAALTVPFDLRESCWIAVRALGPANRFVFGGPLFAHTSPVYVNVGGQPTRVPASARYFVEWIERLIELCRAEGKYETPEQREQVLELFTGAKAVFEEMAER